jgi:hypothetical protein
MPAAGERLNNFKQHIIKNAVTSKIFIMNEINFVFTKKEQRDPSYHITCSCMP